MDTLAEELEILADCAWGICWGTGINKEGTNTWRFSTDPGKLLNILFLCYEIIILMMLPINPRKRSIFSIHNI